MKKVVYAVSRNTRSGSSKMTGVGFITENDLIIANISQKGNAYIRVFEDCVKFCNPIMNRENEFKGNYSEIREIEYETKNSAGDSTGYDRREIELTYSIWYKLVD